MQEIQPAHISVTVIYITINIYNTDNKKILTL